ncbi:hypothetical protein FRB99_000820, partial [Tulasnella sp. 403]
MPVFDVNRPEGPEKKAGIFFDPNLLSEDGTSSLATTAISKCGKFFAYGVSKSGTDSFNIYVRETCSPFNQETAGKYKGNFEEEPGRLSDIIRFVKFSTIVWKHDSSGFFYQRFPEPQQESDTPDGKKSTGIETGKDRDAAVYFHRLNTDQSEDVLVFKDPENPEHLFGVSITEFDGRWLELYTSRDTSHKNKLWLADLHADKIGPNLRWYKVINDFDAEYSIEANDDRKFYVVTNKDAPRKKVVTFELPEYGELQNGTKSIEFKEFIPEDKDGAVLDAFSAANGQAFIVQYSKNVHDEVWIVGHDGSLKERLDPDFLGSMSVSCKRRDDFFFVTMSGFTNPSMVKQYKFPEANSDETKGGTYTLWRKTYLSDLVPEDFSAEQVWYKSSDGISIPMFIVRHKNTPINGTAPAIQYGYGGFSYTITPFFSPSMLTFIKAYRGILAVPGIRGGAEFGEEWHLAGIREKRVQVYDDFIWATKYLEDNGYAGKGKVAINGGSNGGTLVAACVNRAPEGTFGAAVADVGVMDLLKFHRYTIGSAWISDYGNPDNPHDFDFIRDYSPLHNVPTDRVLPPVMLLTGDHDDRVVPHHSFKHIATLQHIGSQNPHPLLLRVDLKSGHGAGKSTKQS